VKKFFHLVSEYRWPIYLAGHLVMSIVACGVLVWYATRPDAPRPIKGYYEAARAWDADEAVEAASRQLGWDVRYELPAGIPHYAGMPRPVDVRVVDREGKPVSGLTGRLFVIRPADSRLNRDGELTELPQQAGSYRTLVVLDEPGAWDVRLDARRQSLRFVHAARLDIPGSTAVQEGTPR
jgi:nitrogen fixation protein FixH